MTDNDIIKALECCSCDNYQCDNCPYAYKTCTVYKDSLDLINRQKAEIEKLKALAENGSSAIDTNNRLVQKFAEIKSEAIKEFAERLKEKSYKTIRNYGLTKDVVEVCDIDNLVKEMESESNE